MDAQAEGLAVNALGQVATANITHIQYAGHIRRSLARLANFANEPFHLTVMGHSIVDGIGAGGTQQLKAANCFTAVMRAALAQALGTTVNEGVIQNEDAYRFTLTNTASAGSNLGFANGFNLTATNQSGAITVNGTVAYAYMWANGANIPLTYTVDGGGSQAATIVSSVQNNGNYFQVCSFNLGSNGSHNLIISGASSAAVTVLFVEGRVSGTSGLTVSRMGLSGAVLADVFAIAAQSSDPLPNWATQPANMKAAQFYSVSSLIGANLATLSFDVNDTSLKSSTYGYAYSLARIQQNVQTVVNAYVAAGIDVLLMTGPWIDQTQSGAYTAPFAQQSAAALYQSVAASTDGCAYLDIRAPFSSYTDENAAGLKADYVHPDVRGHSRLGRLVSRALLQAAA